MTTLKSPDGVTLWYEDSGDGLPIVFIPGLGMNSWHWKYQQELAASHRVITLDPRGHGRSTKEEKGLTLRQTAMDVQQLLVHLNLTDVTLVGWSMGAFVLYEYVALFGSDRLKALCSVDMTPRNTLTDGWKLAVFGNLEPAAVIGAAGGMIDDKEVWLRGLSVACFAPDNVPPDEVVDSWTRNSLTVSLVSLLAFWIDLARSDWREFVSTIEIPTLLAHGAKSLAVPAEAGEWLSRTMPNSTLVMFENSGHAPFWEEPERFNDELRAFIASH